MCVSQLKFSLSLPFCELFWKDWKYCICAVRRSPAVKNYQTSSNTEDTRSTPSPFAKFWQLLLIYKFLHLSSAWTLFLDKIVYHCPWRRCLVLSWHSHLEVRKWCLVSLGQNVRVWYQGWEEKKLFCQLLRNYKLLNVPKMGNQFLIFHRISNCTILHLFECL